MRQFEGVMIEPLQSRNRKEQRIPIEDCGGGSSSAFRELMARVTGLEPATSGVTGRHSNRLSYTRALRLGSVWTASMGVGLRRSFLGVKARERLFSSKLECSVGNYSEQQKPHDHVQTNVFFGLRICTEPLKGPRLQGRLAQLVERFVYTEDVGSSSLSSPTIDPARVRCVIGASPNLHNTVASQT